MRGSAAAKIAMLLCVAACEAPQGAPVCREVGQLAAYEADAGVLDAGSHDAGHDAGHHDGGTSDGGTVDAGSCSPAQCGAATGVKSATGIAASAIHRRADDLAFYVVSGGSPLARFAAIDDTGADRGSFTITGVPASDWEDVAVGPCPGGSCVFIADIGDAQGTRPTYTIYRVPEPEILGAGDHTVTADAIRFTYPDGSHDAAALLVHPVTGALTVVTRDSAEISLIFEIPAATAAGDPVTAVAHGKLGAVATVTAGSVRPNARGALLRTTAGALFYEMSAAQTVAQALGGPVTHVPVARETDGEAITCLPSGSGYLTLDGATQAMSYVLCAPP